MGLDLVAAPSVDPVLAAEAKSHLRVDIDDDDTLIEGYIEAARHDAETFCRRALITQTWDYVIDAWPESDELKLPLPPLQSITSVKYTDVDGVEHTFSSSYYLVATKGTPGRIVLKTGASWPSETLREAEPIVVRFVAGYGDSGDDVPRPIRQAILLITGHLYENREDTVATGNLRPIPQGARSLMWTYRALTF